MSKKMDKVETHVYVAFVLACTITAIIIVSALIYAIYSNPLSSAEFFGGIAVFALIVHLIARKVD